MAIKRESEILLLRAVRSKAWVTPGQVVKSGVARFPLIYFTTAQPTLGVNQVDQPHTPTLSHSHTPYRTPTLLPATQWVHRQQHQSYPQLGCRGNWNYPRHFNYNYSSILSSSRLKPYVPSCSISIKKVHVSKQIIQLQISLRMFWQKIGFVGISLCSFVRGCFLCSNILKIVWKPRTCPWLFYCGLSRHLRMRSLKGFTKCRLPP